MRWTVVLIHMDSLFPGQNAPILMRHRVLFNRSRPEHTPQVEIFPHITPFSTMLPVFVHQLRSSISHSFSRFMHLFYPMKHLFRFFYDTKYDGLGTHAPVGCSLHLEAIASLLIHRELLNRMRSRCLLSKRLGRFVTEPARDVVQLDGHTQVLFQSFFPIENNTHS